MSYSPLPEYVDARKVFVQSGRVIGVIAPRQLEQLNSLVVGDEGEVKVELFFTLDEFGRQRISGNIEAKFQVSCQRCLEPVLIQLKDHVNLVVVADDEIAKALDIEFDPWIVPANKIEIASLIDEQLLLNMPIVSYHQQGPCSENQGYSSPIETIGDRKNRHSTDCNPFAILDELRKQKD